LYFRRNRKFLPVRRYCALRLQKISAGWQAIPGVEQWGPSASRVQTAQPSLHSRQAALRSP